MKKLTLLLCLAGSAPAWAQFGELWFNAGWSVMNSADLGSVLPAQLGGRKDDYQLTNGFRFGFRIGFNNDTILGHEFQYAYSRAPLRFTPTGQELGMAVHTGGYNFLVYGTPEGTRVRPFATGGLIFSNYVPPGASAAQGGGSTKFGFNYGGGVKVRVGDRWAVRLDLRQYTTPKPNFGLLLTEGWIRQTEASAGFGFVF